MGRGHRKIASEVISESSFLLNGLATAEKCLGLLSDVLYLKILYFIRLHKLPNLKHPSTYSEKIQWYKLHYRPEMITFMADKSKVKTFVAEKLGAEKVIPLLGIWDSFDQIDFDILPDSFVLKCTHDSGSTIICNNKETFDFKHAKRIFKLRLSRNFYLHNREWAYRNIKPKIIAEPYICCADGKRFNEYKLFCFDGHAEWIVVCRGQANTGERTNDIFDRDFNRVDVRMNKPCSKEAIIRPECMDDIIHYSEVLSQDIPHVRVDFYESDGKVFFGEMTFYPDGGFVRFDPPEWDLHFGDRFRLPYPSPGSNR